MIATLNEQMVKVRGHFDETGRHQRHRNPLKSYLVEANVSEVAEGSVVVSDFLSSDLVSIPVQVQQTDDPRIHRIFAGKDRTEFWLDTLDDRYWVFHTTESATDADTAIRKLVNNSLNLDSTWLPSGFFESTIADLGYPRQITSKFSVRTGLYQEALPEDLSSDALVMRMGGTLERWRRIKTTPELARNMALWSARIIRRDDDIDQFADDDVTASGKVTARGDSFEMHQEVLLVLRNSYSELIGSWESRYRLDWQRGPSGIEPAGQPAVISFPGALNEEDLGTLAVSLFEGGEPYRLFGSPRRQSDRRFVTKAVDLHTGSRLTFEITSSLIRVYLPNNACGNVLARLLTNLQHFFDARVSLGDVQ